MIIDVLLVLVIFAGVYSGYELGLLSYLKFLLIVIFALIFTLKLANVLSDLIFNLTGFQALWSMWILVLLSLLLFLWLVYKVGKYMADTYNKEKLSMIKKVLGGFFLACCFTILYAYVVYFLAESEVISTDNVSSGFTGKYLVNLAKVGNGLLDFGQGLFISFEELARDTLDSTPGNN